jgi:hypothetical protein
MGARRYEIYLQVFKLEWDIEFEHKKINSYLQASMYYFVYYINMEIVEIADWLKLDINTCEKLSYQNTCAQFSIYSVNVLEILRYWKENQRFIKKLGKMFFWEKLDLSSLGCFINVLIMVIELSGVQFGLKSCDNTKLQFVITSMMSAQNCMTRSSITT